MTRRRSDMQTVVCAFAQFILAVIVICAMASGLNALFGA